MRQTVCWEIKRRQWQKYVQGRTETLLSSLYIISICGFSSSHVWMWESDHKESWAPKNWCFWTVVLEKSPTPLRPLHPTPLRVPWTARSNPVNPKGNQSWILIGRTDADAEAEAPVLWPPDANNWLIAKDPDAGKDWMQEEKGTTEDEMTGWHH